MRDRSNPDIASLIRAMLAAYSNRFSRSRIQGPMYSTVKTLESYDGRERVLIARRPDGAYTYQRQWLSAALPNDDPDSPIIQASEELEGEWGPPGPDCGIYDSADTAETEARLSVPWLRQQFN
jgi:hypothetical protein